MILVDQGNVSLNYTGLHFNQWPDALDGRAMGQKQLDSLIRLVTHLYYKYDIPIKNIKGHKEMPGANTDCPGKNFPWEKLRKALRERGCE